MPRHITQVREGGFEPPRPFGHRILSPARLPDSATLATQNVLVTAFYVAAMVVREDYA